MEKNNLDKLFKDKFYEFSEAPDDVVWERIEASLNKKKSKRIIPIWWQLGGVAAALAVILYLINPFNSENTTSTPTIVDSERQIENPKEDFFKNGKNEDTKENTSDTQVVFENNSSDKNNTTSQNDLNAATNSKNTKEVVPPKEQQNLLKTQNGVAQNYPIKNKKEEKTLTNSQNEGGIANPIPTAENSEIVTTTKNGKSSTKNNKATKNEGLTLDIQNKKEIAESLNEDDQTKSIYDAIAEKESLEEEAVVKNEKINKWTMGPSLAPVFFSSIGEGSPIHSNFASNSKTGNVNLSYGLTVAYNINKKLSVRSGVHRVDYGYDTNDIVFTSSLTTSTNQLIDNITYARTSRNLVVTNKNDASLTDANSPFATQAQPLEGRMVQQLGYLEVPVELNYALLDKKFGVNIIGGVSSLFLVDNTVNLESEQLITEMGAANNANDVNFSTNIGLGLNYEVSPKLQLNVEPIFKYQLNTFSEAAGNFRPYSVGVYSGLSFNF